MKKINIAIWGLGRHSTSRIIPALSCIEELSIVGVCSRNPQSVAKYALEFGCVGWTDSSEMLNNVEVDIVYIATPIGVHAEQAEQALKAGKHVWSEKPLTCNYEDTKFLVNLAKQNKKMLTEGFMFLHHPQFKKIQDYIKEKKYGQVHSIICRFGIPKLEKPGFRNDPKLCGGAFWDVGSYTIAAVLELFPDENVEVLFSELSSRKNFKVDTEGRVLLRFSQGTTAYLEWATGVAYKNEIDLWSDKNSIFTKKIFSKPENYQPIYRIDDTKGNESLINGLKSEQFIEMFRDYYSIYGSPLIINNESEKIMRRAKVMDKIVNFSGYIKKN